MLESILGHDKWLNPPEDHPHLEDCPANPDHELYPEECCCFEIAEHMRQEAAEQRAIAREEA